ncbi:cupin domain-containing protein [Polynucleobacter sp. 15G-AUS-farblos]|uniref:cupin domain-containing protein n=1 Tax=Polynucleobacter sp. 15G-AUS-farblos TaxID=2689094 RepID=UPI001C0CFD68|nr:cupin domain-containing protein [Polynucleobacter sp. 15G-AUS-farblos]MBU3582533.1 cupin domain-containing protein [Polynucleobacter sp. 15G-AUS-farblos]
MNREQFFQKLEKDGYPHPVEVVREPNGSLGDHTHPFEVIALVLSGNIELTVEGITSHYQAGEAFHLKHEQPHSETYGPNGVHYLAARK